MSRIEQVIAEIEDYIEDCRPTAFSASKIVVQKEELQEKLSELRMAIPEELDKSKRILNNQNNIIMDAQARYNTLVNEASKKTGGSERYSTQLDSVHGSAPSECAEHHRKCFPRV